MNDFSSFGFESKTGKIVVVMDMSLENAKRLLAIMTIAGIDFAYSEHAGFAENVPAKGRLRFFPTKPLSDEDTAAIVALLDQPPVESTNPAEP